MNRAVECISVRTALVSESWPARFARWTARDGTELSADTDDGRTMERTIAGPAIVRLPDATLRVAAGWTARALPIGGWFLETT